MLRIAPRDQITTKFLYSAPVPKLGPAPPPRVSAPTTSVALADVKKALSFVDPNELDYDAWRNTIFSIHSASGGSDAGLTLAHEWSARSSKHNPDFLDGEVWPFIRERDGGITARTIFAKAAEHGYVESCESDFDIVEASSTPDKLRYDFVPIEEVIKRPYPAWIVQDVVPQAALVVLVGEPGAGKSFIALDMVAAVSRGIPWGGKDTKQMKVAYIAAEGAAGFRKRCKAYMKQHGLETLPVGVLEDAPNLLQKKDAADIIAGLERRGPFGLAVVDTLAQSMPGGDENSAEGMGKVLAHCREIHTSTGAAVVLIHHTGKDLTRGARGWSGLKGAADAEIEVTGTKGDRLLTVTKQKDGELGVKVGFRLHQIPIGTDDKGKDVTSCFVETFEHTTKVKKEQPEGPYQTTLMNVIGDMVALGVDVWVDTGEVLDAAKGHIEYDTESGKRDRRSQYLVGGLNVLQAKKLVEMDTVKRVVRLCQ